MRLDLAFILCCCKAILGPLHSSKDGGTGEADFYQLLGVERDASADDIKKAYKRQSLQMHPDKLAQRGKTVTEEDKARFTRMREAYEVLSDPHKRETYDAVGERGMKWLTEPFAMDPRELVNNFASASTLDKSKIFAIFVVLFVCVLLIPVLVCLQTDHLFGVEAKWSLVLLPLWIWNILILFYHVRVIMLGPIPKPEDIPEDQWVDPLPMSKRYASLGKFILTVMYEVIFALQLDHIVHLQWRALLVPFLFLEGLNIIEKMGILYRTIITVADLEQKLGKSLGSDNLSASDKEFIQRFLVVPSLDSLEHIIAIDGKLNWSWWGLFSPFWILSILTCFGNMQYYTEMSAQVAAMEEAASSKVDDSKDVEKQSNGQEAGSVPMGIGTAPSSQEQTSMREEMQVQLAMLRKQFVGSCCSQILLVLVLCLFAAKLEGASFSSLWLISPLILFASIILCVIGCAIYCFHAPINDENMTAWDYHESNDSMNNNNNPKNTPIVTGVPSPIINSYQKNNVTIPTYAPPTLHPDVNILTSRETVVKEATSAEPDGSFNLNSAHEPLDPSTGASQRSPIFTAVEHPMSSSSFMADDEEPGIIHSNHINPTNAIIVDGIKPQMIVDVVNLDPRHPPFENNIHDLD